MLNTIALIFDLIVLSAGAAVLVDWIIKEWYSIPLVETDEGPHFYAVKELFNVE